MILFVRLAYVAGQSIIYINWQPESPREGEWGGEGGQQKFREGDWNPKNFLDDEVSPMKDPNTRKKILLLQFHLIFLTITNSSPRKCFNLSPCFSQLSSLPFFQTFIFELPTCGMIMFSIFIFGKLFLQFIKKLYS